MWEKTGKERRETEWHNPAPAEYGTLQPVNSTGTAACLFWRVKYPNMHMWGTPSFASFKLGLFFNLLIPNRSQSLHFSGSLETLELLMPARKHILLRSQEYLYSVSNTNRRFKYCSSGVFVRKGKQSEREAESMCTSVCWTVIGCAYERVRILCERVLYKYACECQTLHSHRVFPALLLSSEQQAGKNSLEEQSGILPLTEMMVQMLIVTLNDSQIGWDTVNLAKLGNLVQQVHWADFTPKNLVKIDSKIKKD